MRVASLLLLAACQQSVGFQKPLPEDTAEDTGDSGPDDTGPIDTADTDGDLDDDGYTPEDGDCDDDDVRVSPGRPEEGDDDVDNDCDGLVDEEWAGFTFSWVTEEGDAWLQPIDKIGRLGDAVTVSGCIPYGIDRWGDGFATTDGAAVYEIAADGTCTALADYSDTDYGIVSITTAADQGAVYASGGNALYEVAADGTSTTMGEWVEINEEGTETFYIVSAVTNPTTGDVGLFDIVGGFGTWNKSRGVTQRKLGPYDAPTWQILAGGFRAGDGWYAIAQDLATDEYVLLHWDDDADDWVASDRWTSQWAPYAMALDQDHGDFYFTASAAWSPAVFRIVEGGNYVDDLYTADPTVYQFFLGIVADYTHD